MRKKNKEISDWNEIIEVMKRCDVCRLAFNDKEDYPYILPLNFGLDISNGIVKLYFHSATEGYKWEVIARDNRATFEMDCEHELEYFAEQGYCTMAYESVIGRGKVTELEEEEKVAALQKLMDHYHAEHTYYNPAAISRTRVYALTVESMTGKRKEKKS